MWSYALALSSVSIPHSAEVAEVAMGEIVVDEVVSIESRFDGAPLVEPHLSAHPRDPDHLLVAAMVVTDIARPYESCRLSTFVSGDGGRSWTERAHDWWGYDPWTVIRADGRAYMSWLGTEGRFEHRFPVRFFTSPDGGRSWDEEVQTREGSHDGTKLACGGEGGNDVYFTTVQFREHGGADVVLERLTAVGAGDAGAGLGDDIGAELFREVARVDGAGVRLGFCEPAVLGDGTVLVPATHHLRRAWVQRLEAGARALSEPIEVTRRPGGARGYLRLVADASPGSPRAGHVYLVRALGAVAQGDGVWLNVSRDGGRSWEPDRRIDLFSQAGESHACLATAAVARDGTLAVAWVDRRDDPDGEWTDVYVTVSQDGGRSCLRPVRVTDVSTDPVTPDNGPVASHFRGGGHYMGLAARADGRFQLVWSDSRRGLFELQTAAVGVGEGG